MPTSIEAIGTRPGLEGFFPVEEYEPVGEVRSRVRGRCIDQGGHEKGNVHDGKGQQPERSEARLLRHKHTLPPAPSDNPLGVLPGADRDQQRVCDVRVRVGQRVRQRAFDSPSSGRQKLTLAVGIALSERPLPTRQSVTLVGGCSCGDVKSPLASVSEPASGKNILTSHR